jgi:hypothetical protein
VEKSEEEVEEKPQEEQKEAPKEEVKTEEAKTDEKAPESLWFLLLPLFRRGCFCFFLG